ncbi:hypothetical protein J0S82_009584, partial [Galemys pyrenaicus]
TQGQYKEYPQKTGVTEQATPNQVLFQNFPEEMAGIHAIQTTIVCTSFSSTCVCLQVLLGSPCPCPSVWSTLTCLCMPSLETKPTDRAKTALSPTTELNEVDPTAVSPAPRYGTHKVGGSGWHQVLLYLQ